MAELISVVGCLILCSMKACLTIHDAIEMSILYFNVVSNSYCIVIILCFVLYNMMDDKNCYL